MASAYDLQLTEHFTLREFTYSPTAVADDIDNTPSLQSIINLQQLCVHVLEPLRQYFNRPVQIGSGYRCDVLNKRVGGVTNSQHRQGMAADIHLPDNIVGQAWFNWIKSNCVFDQLIWEKASPDSKRYWIHVSYNPFSSNRRQVINNLIKNS